MSDCNSCNGLQKDLSQVAKDAAVLQFQVQSLTRTCEKLETSVEELNATLNQSKGGWFVLTAVATLGAAAASAVFALYQFFAK